MSSIEYEPLPVLKGTDYVKEEEVDRLEISPPPYCNLACLGCYAGAGRLIRVEQKRLGRPFLTTEEWLEIIDKLPSNFRALSISGHGEILQDWQSQQRLIKKALDKELSVKIYTNGTLMDEAIADWIDSCGISVVGKWCHSDPSENNQMMDVTGKAGVDKHCKYVEVDGMMVPKHMALLMERGLNTDYRLAVDTTIFEQNKGVIPFMWLWLRDHNIIPVFSWPVPTGWGIVAARDYGIAEEEKEALTGICWDIDRKFGISWDFTLGPHIGGSRCTDDTTLYIGPMGEMRLCVSDYHEPSGWILEDGIDVLLQEKRVLNESNRVLRQEVTGKASCLCAECAKGR